MVVIQIGKRGIQPVDASGRLDGCPVRGVLGIEDDRVGSYAVPAFRSGGALYEIYPLAPIRNFFVFVSVPFSHERSFWPFCLPQDFKLVVKVVEYDCFRVLFHEFDALYSPIRIFIDGLTKLVAKFSCVLNWGTLLNIEPFAILRFISHEVVITENVFMMRYGFSFESHLNQYHAAIVVQTTFIHIPGNLRILSVV